MPGTMILSNEISARMSSSVLLPPDVWSGSPERQREAVDRSFSPWIVFASPVGREKSTSQATEIVSFWKAAFTPRTDLGKRLYVLRTKAITAGMKLLSEEEVLEEVKRRRGEVEDYETDLH